MYQLWYILLNFFIKMTVNRLNPQSNTIRNLDKGIFSHNEKQELIDALKTNRSYKKDENKKTASLEQNRNKIDILKKLENQWVEESVIENVKWSLYPEYKQYQSQKTSESSEHLGMNEELIQEAIGRNKIYNKKYNTDKQVREVCSKLNYTRESLGNGREKHMINGIPFSFPKSNEFTFADMKNKNAGYTMDIVSEDGKNQYDKFQTETGMNKLSPDKVYELLWEFAKAMGIPSTIDYYFFEWNSAKSQGLLQIFRNITGFEGRITLNITNKWYVEFLCCNGYSCWFDVYSGDDNYVAFLSGL